MKELLSVCFILVSIRLCAQEMYFPPVGESSWERIEPSSLNWCEESIDEIYQYLETNGTKSFLILKDGKIVIERYFGDHNLSKQWTWFSAGKSLRALLVGIAQQDGLLNIEEKTSDYLGKGWTNLDENSEDQITVRNQLTMTTGLDERFFDCITPSCLLKRADAGTRWVYHNGPYNLLKEVLEAATGQTINDYTKSAVRDQIGMETGVWLATGNNTFFVSTARDMARFGLLIQNDGKWDETPVLNDQAYFNQMVNTSQELNPSYGYLWWLNGKSSFIAPSSPMSFQGSIAPNAPEDLITAAGAQGQFISISKTSGLVMIRQGLSDETDLAALPLIDEIWKRINAFESESCEVITSNEAAFSEKIDIYPNPANDLITLKGIAEATAISVTLIDISGKKLFSTINHSAIDVSTVRQGHYLLEIVSDKKVIYRRLIIE